MNCSYRILENVHIGLRVRKTKDKTTVAYKNEPIADVYIKDWNDQGFRLQHEAFPTKDNTVWLDFVQLPLNQLTIKNGIIENPLVFVEKIMNGGGSTSMVLLKADTFDYLELLEDKKIKEEKELLSPRSLSPGDRVISAICKESLEMIFLGIFNVANLSYKSGYSYSHRYSDNRKTYYIDSTPERAYFAYPQANGSYVIKSYPVTNKVVKEVYRVKENPTSELFSNESRNIELLQARFTNNNSYIRATKNLPYPERFKLHLIIIEYSSGFYVQKNKNQIKENALSWFSSMYNSNDKMFVSEEEADDHLRR
jgi:hypothetical protein